MIQNLFKIAYRNLLKNKLFSVINILGLAFGLCCAMLIVLWVSDEYSIDKFHTKKDHLYWVISELKPSTGSLYWTNSPGPLAEVVEDEVAGVEKAVRFSSNRNQLFKNELLSFEESGISADPAFLTIFDFPLIRGDIQSALDDPYNVVISKQLAEKLFPESEAFNKTVVIDDWGRQESFKITGILDDIPEQSTLQFEFIVPFKTYLKQRPWNLEWGNYNDRTVLLLEETAEVEAVSEQVVDIIPRHYEEAATQLHLYPFEDVYLKANFSKGLNADGRIIYVRIFSVIAVVILLLACINFMNLSTAKAGKRAKEVGVRKATGANRRSLIIQFLGESILIALISGVLAVTIADILMVPFNELTGKSVGIPYSSAGFMIGLVVVCILTGTLAGIYPALYLSGFKPAQVLKSAINGGKSLSGFRRVLVVFQFSLSITFIVTTIIVYSQLQFILNKDVGFQKENILHHDLNGIMGNRAAYRNEILQLPGVREMSNANFSPMSIHNSTRSVDWKGKTENEEIHFHVIQTDEYFVETFGLALLEGRDFSHKYDTAALEVLINETAARVMGLDQVAGSRIELWDDEVEVVGIVKDFHHQSLAGNIEPVVVFFNPRSAWRNFIAINGDISQTLNAVEEVYLKFEKNYPFDYGFVDQDYAEMYSNISVMGRLSNIFALVAIFISSLGLFGLASYMTEQRKKETGIRKVMGASVFGLVTMFSMNILGLVLISFIISTPIAWYLAAQWLGGFAFKIDMDIWPFLVGGVLAIVVALATVSYHTIKAALTNPADSLKCE